MSDRSAPALHIAAAMALCVAATTAPRLSNAQDSLPLTHPAPNECLRFAFGQWSTPLDWKTAGHRDAPEDPAAGAPRGDASRQAERAGDLVIYPAWWPVGVYIELDSARTRGDTLVGTATAFVANGNVDVPTAEVRAWHVACRSRPEADPRVRRSLNPAPAVARPPGKPRKPAPSPAPTAS